MKKSFWIPGLVVVVLATLAVAAVHSRNVLIESQTTDATPKATAPLIPQSKPQAKPNPTASKQPEFPQPTGNKIVYLTFDDGPSKKITPIVLQTLRENGVKATFFVLGKMCVRNPQILKEIAAEGHYIANHSYTHEYKEIYSSEESFVSDLLKCQVAIKSILGPEYSPKLYRFPGGAYGKKMKPFIKRLAKLGYSYVNWNATIADSAYAHVPSKSLVSNAKVYSKGKDHVILLMHDSDIKDTTAQALPGIIKYFKSQGYRFETLAGYQSHP